MMLTMSGHDRSFEVPARLRSGGTPPQLTAWDCAQLGPETPGPVRAWAGKVVRSVITAAAAPGAAALDCDDCDDTGWYGLPDPRDPDTLVSLYRRHGDGYRTLTADGRWVEPTHRPDDLIEVLTLDVAHDLASAIVAGASGLVRRYCTPLAFLPPSDLLVPSPHPEALLAAVAAPAAPEQAPTDDGNQWLAYAIVDPLDPGAVLNVVRLRPGPIMERYDQGGAWVPDPPVLASLTGLEPPPLVELDPDVLSDVLRQVDSGQVDGEEPDAVAAAGKGGDAETLRRHWSKGGEGGAKIRWGTPGDWTRCFRYLSKYMGTRAKGYCQNMHKRNTGEWAGARAASGTPQMMSTEEALNACVASGAWVGTSTATMTTTTDRIYEAATDLRAPVIRSLVAGAFPVVPPADWFEDPRLTTLTPLTVEESGRVYGHMADFNMPHIGLPGNVRPPRSRSGYQFFQTGQIPALAADGTRKLVRVGQLTSVGGHAPMSADAGQAVAHYDNTASAVADVSVGEDRHGIWFAGSLRPDATPEQVRTFMASALSGDWRPINGGLELVACCSVNVPGFPIPRARVASGAVMALVAGGATTIAEKAAMMTADRLVLEKLASIETELEVLRASVAAAPIGGEEAPADPVDTAPVEAETTISRVEVVQPEPVEAEPAPTVEPEAEAEPEEEAPREVPPSVAKARQRAMERRAALSARVHRTSVDVELAKLVAAATTPRPVTAAFKLEPWMTPTGSDGTIVKTGDTIAVSSKTDESVAVGKVQDVTRRGLKVKWTAGKTGSATISIPDVAALVRVTAAKKDAASDGEAGGADPKASTSPDGDDAVTAAFNPKQLRDNRGQWIEMGAIVNVKQDDGSERRGKVVQLTSTGPQVKYDDDGSVEIVLAKDTGERVESAPDAKATLPGGKPGGPLQRGADGKVKLAPRTVIETGDGDRIEQMDLTTPAKDLSDDDIATQLGQLDELDEEERGPELNARFQELVAEANRRGEEDGGGTPVPVSALTDGAVSQLDTSTPAKDLSDDEITKQVEQLDELTPEERGPELNARLKDLEDEANRRFQNENRYDIEGTRARAEETAAQYDAPAASPSGSGGGFPEDVPVGYAFEVGKGRVPYTVKASDKVPADTPIPNAAIIHRAAMMHGSGSAKHKAAIAQYGGPKPKKKARPLPGDPT